MTVVHNTLSLNASADGGFLLPMDFDWAIVLLESGAPVPPEPAADEPVIVEG